MDNFRLTPLAMALSIASLAPFHALAADPPDAGLLYQESQPTIAPPPPSSLELNLQGEPLQEGQSGGAKVTLRSVQIEGNSIFSNEQLKQQLGTIEGKEYDLAGLRELANEISRYYRSHGYPFARAMLPPQNLAKGMLKLTVVEGQYGQVTNQSDDDALAKTVDRYLSPLSPGDVIESAPLERQLLLLSDLPGVEATPVLRPGQQQGSGDLEVTVSQGSRIHGGIGMNNYGSRYSGEYRGQGNLQINHLLMVGDELTLSASYSSEDTWLGSVGYSLPLWHNGLRAQVSYSHTDYQLGHGFEGYEGTAKVTSAGLSYPIIRTQATNLTVTGSYQYKDLDDDTPFDFSQGSHSHTLPVGLNFNHQDGLLGGGVSWGALTVTPGKTSSHATGTGSSDQDFTKWDLEVARIQNLGAGFSLYGRASGQWADRKELDGSENFYLGGPNAVRSYPVGEGSGSRGYLGQLELRYQIPVLNVQSYGFFDSGYSPNGGIDVDDSRRISGAGLGLRYNIVGISIDGAVAWKVNSDDAQSDDKQRDPRFWLTTSYNF